MILFAALVAAWAVSLPPCSRPLPKSPEGNYIIPGALGDIPYSNNLVLDAYAPPGEPRPAAVIFHGRQGNQRTHVTQLFEVLGRAGYAWFSVNYRNLEDAKRALDYLRCPGCFNITRSLVLVGEDTGADIALRLAARENVKGVVTFGAKFSDLANDADAQAGAGSSGRRKPGPWGDTGLEPGNAKAAVLMFHGTADDEASPAQAEAFCKRLRNCRFVPVPGAIHNFENWHPDQWFWKEELTAWLRGERRGLWKAIAYARPEGRELLLDAWIPEGLGHWSPVSGH